MAIKKEDNQWYMENGNDGLDEARSPLGTFLADN